MKLKNGIFFYLIIVNLLMTAIFDSCRIKDPDRPKPNVKVIIPSNDTITVDSNSVVNFKFEISSDTILYKWVLTYYKLNEDSVEVISPVTLAPKLENGKKKFNIIKSNTMKLEEDTTSGQILGAFTKKVFSDTVSGSFTTDSIIESGSIFKVNLYAIDDGDLGSSGFFYIKVVKNYLKTPMADFITNKFRMRIHNSVAENKRSFTINVDSTFFSPTGLLVNIGDTIVWKWNKANHSTTSTKIPTGADPWDSGFLNVGATYPYIVKVPGDYRFICKQDSFQGTFTAKYPCGEDDVNNNSGYDFLNDTIRYASAQDSVKDMINITFNSPYNPADSNFHAVFAHGWKSLNGTLYVFADSSIDFETATLEKAIAAFNKGTKKTQISFASLEDIFVVKLRGKENYILMKITDVYDDFINKPDKDGNYYDCDYIGFRYRRKK
ncbi:MAG: hypothetical protein A3H98_14700 [Bacteroidetes bacterium RIFCSPLOWO2_02_FULL_36_8]|nr:MAG: hypothetical protein A3H98_14700 [Bacteroidetes bacterium RIFCSPLOWO2_02_FULL_36_8]OFY71587.1 MAG: hypothetical protein A3G23_02560 [Bacteroidetes bacterium RIFCSPLOWO2_12_FULL_37_12]